MTYVLLCLFGVCIGLLSGMLGIGGGIAMVPGLVMLFGFTQTQGQGTSLAVLSLPVAIFAAFEYYRNDNVRLPVVGWVALGFVVGAYLGAYFVNAMPQAWTPGLHIAFGMVLLYVGFLYVLAPSSAKSVALLPAGLASLVASLLAWFLRRKVRPQRQKPPPPGDELEYHL